MSPIESISPVDPSASEIEWQDWKTGGGNEESEEIRSTYESVSTAIAEAGAACIKISGDNPIHGSDHNEANYWGGTLRRKFKEVGRKISTKVKQTEEGTFLFIKIKR